MEKVVAVVVQAPDVDAVQSPLLQGCDLHLPSFAVEKIIVMINLNVLWKNDATGLTHV